MVSIDIDIDDAVQPRLQQSQDRQNRVVQIAKPVGPIRHPVKIVANISFDFDSARIKPQFYGPLDNLAATLRKYPQSYIDVIGHTDAQGDASYNQALSERRARAVQSYLAARGVNQARMVAYGQGESQPVATNDTAAGRAANRRVELRITPAT